MCIIIALRSREDKDITKKTMKICWKNNPDGAGFMYTSDGAVRVQKGFMSFKTFYREFQKARFTNSKSLFGVHFRTKSCGEINKENCHPFWIRKNKSAMMHNGTIADLKDDKDPENDSSKLAKMLGELPVGWGKNDAIIELLIDYIGTNKILILSKDNQFSFFNRELGHFDGTAWYSNDSYKPDEKKEDDKGNVINSVNVSRPDMGEPQTTMAGLMPDDEATYTEKCSECGLPLFLEQDFDTGKCFHHYSNEEKKELRIMYRSVKCKYCNNKIYGDDALYHKAKICKKCAIKDEAKGHETTVLLGQKVIEYFDKGKKK